MAFNKGYELKKFEAHWEKLRIEYAAAGMAEDAIQKMYDYDRQQFNSERTRIERTQEFTAPAYESTEEEASPLMLRYQEAITTTDTYHETKRSFAWIGEIEDENLLAALEQLSDSDLELITLYAYEEYDTVEISKLFGTTKQNISKKIRGLRRTADCHLSEQCWIPCPLWKVLASGQLARNGRQPDLHGRSPLRRCPLRIDARTPDHPAGGV